MEHILNSRKQGRTYAMLLELKAAMDRVETTRFFIMCPSRERSRQVYKLAKIVFGKACTIVREERERAGMTDMGIFDKSKQLDFYVVVEKRML